MILQWSRNPFKMRVSGKKQRGFSGTFKDMAGLGYSSGSLS
jgi:hypothetical protein